MAKDIEKTSVEECFDSLTNVNFEKYENEWILIARNKIVFHAPTEDDILNYSKKHYSDIVPCIVKVPMRKTMMM